MKPIVLNLRGANGSGKTTAVNKMLGPSPWPKQVILDGKIVKYNQSLYYPQRVCLNCDPVHSQDAVCEWVRYAVRAKFQEIVFEGVIVSTIWQRYAELCDEMTRAGCWYIWGFLMPDLPTALDRIQKRNGGKEINSDLVADKQEMVRRGFEKALAAGYDAYDFTAADYRDPTPAPWNLPRAELR